MLPVTVPKGSLPCSYEPDTRPILNQKKPVHILAPCFRMAHFNIVLQFMPGSLKLSLPFRFYLIIILKFLSYMVSYFTLSCNLVHSWTVLYILFRCRIWAERAGCLHLLEKGVEVLNTSYRLCSDHFHDRSYTSTERRRLSNYALPEIFTHNSGKIHSVCRVSEYCKLQSFVER